MCINQSLVITSRSGRKKKSFTIKNRCRAYAFYISHVSLNQFQLKKIKYVRSNPFCIQFKFKPIKYFVFAHGLSVITLHLPRSVSPAHRSFWPFSVNRELGESPRTVNQIRDQNAILVFMHERLPVSERSHPPLEGTLVPTFSLFTIRPPLHS